MTTEYERRYRLSRAHVDAIERHVSFSASMQVTDLTFGQFGIESMSKAGWVLRVRSQGGQPSRLEYKGRVADDVWDEVGFEISDVVAAVAILEKIGLRPGLLIERNRRTAVEDGFLLSLDEVRWLGWFLEVEAQSPLADTSVVRLLERLGVLQAEAAPPYGDLLEEVLRFEEVAAAEHSRAILELVQRQ